MGPRSLSLISLREDEPWKRYWCQLTAEVNHEEPHHADSCPTSGGLFVEMINVPRKNNGDNDMTSAHADGAHCQHRLSTDSINPQDSRDGGDEHDDTNDAGSKETSGCSAES